jgi:hypothetical protein
MLVPQILVEKEPALTKLHNRKWILEKLICVVASLDTPLLFQKRVKMLMNALVLIPVHIIAPTHQEVTHVYVHPLQHCHQMAAPVLMLMNVRRIRVSVVLTRNVLMQTPATHVHAWMVMNKQLVAPASPYLTAQFNVKASVY